jgi:hypothetical protein
MQFAIYFVRSAYQEGCMKLMKTTMIVLLCLNVQILASAVAAEKEETMQIVTTTAEVEYWLIES